MCVLRRVFMHAGAGIVDSLRTRSSNGAGYSTTQLLSGA